MRQAIAVDRERVIRRYFDELFGAGRVEILSELLAEDYVNHSPGSAELARTREGVAIVVAALRAAFPDLRYTIEDMVVGDTAIAVRTVMTGTHRGDFFGLPATGRQVRVAQMTIETFRESRIVAHHRVTDELALMRQLGVVPGQG